MASLLEIVKNLFKPRPVKLVGDALYAACVAQSRLPRFYLDYGVEDAIGARFELLTLHVVMVVTALKSGIDTALKPQADDTSQALFDAFLLALDTTLREQGTGDLTVPKKMKTIGTVVYTRLGRWDELWKDVADRETQAAYLAATVFAGGESDEGEVATVAVLDRARALADYVADARAALSAAELLAGRAEWPEPADSRAAA